MSFKPHGKHLIAGDWVQESTTFQSTPVSGLAVAISSGSAEHVDSAAAAAESTFPTYAATTRDHRAAFLNAIADEIDARGDNITAIGVAETGLPAGRLQGERGRTVGQLRLFADHILQGDYLDRRHDKALPDRAPMPRPDLRLIQRPVGPVAVFGASNFPLAFSTAGGDTASALAAGCPVVVKGHPAHPGMSEIVAEAILAAIKSSKMPAGVFSLIQGDNMEVGSALVKHALIKAVGFTGSLRGGRALYDLCAARSEPIPFFGELGSVNPMFILPGAAQSRASEIAKGWAGSLTMGAGQFCTNPGLVVMLDGPEADIFDAAATDALHEISAQTMLTDGIANAYRDGVKTIGQATGVDTLVASDSSPREATPFFARTTATTLLEKPVLAFEVFGPAGLVVRAANMDEMRSIAASLEGQLTCTLQIDAVDTQDARALIPILERKAGRLLANGFPTGVEVADAMVHGGPFPASTNFGATSVGTMAIRRFLRPVCYQDLPEALLPLDLL